MNCVGSRTIREQLLIISLELVFMFWPVQFSIFLNALGSILPLATNNTPCVISNKLLRSVSVVICCRVNWSVHEGGQNHFLDTNACWAITLRLSCSVPTLLVLYWEHQIFYSLVLPLCRDNLQLPWLYYTTVITADGLRVLSRCATNGELGLLLKVKNCCSNYWYW